VPLINAQQRSNHGEPRWGGGVFTFNHMVEYSEEMVAPILYLTFPGNAREALEFYASVFGGEVQLHTYAAFSRTDGPADAIAHGSLDRGPVSLFGSDAAPGEVSMRLEGAALSLLGAAEPDVLHTWFDRLAESGTVLDPLEPKPWGASDGQVLDRYGLRWLVGYESGS
jgi:PhnB protein